MGILSRASYIIRSKVNAVLNRAENPQETLDYSYEQLRDQLQDVKQGIADLTTQKKRLEIQKRRLEENVEKHNEQAREAVRQGRDDLPRKALEKKKQKMSQIEGLEDQVAELQRQQDQLVEKKNTLQSRIEEFRTRKETMKARYEAAEASAKVSEAMTGAGLLEFVHGLRAGLHLLGALLGALDGPANVLELVAGAGHRLGDFRAGLRGLVAGLHRLFLGAELLDAALEGIFLLDELVLLALEFRDLTFEVLDLVHLLFFLLQRLAREVVPALVDGLAGLLVVFLDVLFEAAFLDLEAFLLSRQVRDPLFDLLELVPELLVGVIERLLGILGPVQDGVDLRPDHVGRAREYSHISALWPQPLKHSLADRSAPRPKL